MIKNEEDENLEEFKNQEDIDYFIEFLLNSSKLNQLVVLFNDKATKISRENYYPENGLVVFKNQNDWAIDGFSAFEMTEFLTKYRDKINKIQFTTSDGTVENFVNAYESEMFSDYGNYASVIIVGDGTGVMKFYGKINPETSKLSWSSDTLYGSYRKTFRR